MEVKTENNEAMAAEPNNVTSPIAHNDSSPEQSNVTASTARKDSSPDKKSEDSSESGEEVVPSPSNVQTVNVPTPAVTVYKRTPKPATAVTTPTNNHNQDARRLTIPNMIPSFTSIDAALGDGLFGREPMTIANDDVAAVKIDTNSQAWVTKLVSAFGQDYLTTPEDPTKNTPAQLDWFTRWQKQAHASIFNIIHSKNDKHLERSCWNLLEAILKAHELGVVDAGGNLSPSGLKCSERLAFIVSMLEKYALIRLDVLRAWHVDEIAANPEAFIKRKLVNCWNNGNRAEKAKEASAAAKKRNASKVDEQDGESEVQTPVKAKKALKSKVDATDDKADSETNTNNPHSALTPDSDDKESTPSEHPTTLNASSSDAAENDAGDAVDAMDED